MPREIEATVERWPIAGSFSIARGSKREAVVVVATIREAGFAGRGECVPYARYGETVEAVAAAIRAMAGAIAAGMDRAGASPGDARRRRPERHRLRALGPRGEAAPVGAPPRSPACRASSRSRPPIR